MPSFDFMNITQIKAGILASGQIKATGGSEELVYTVPPNTLATVSTFSIHSMVSSTQLIYGFIVPAGQSESPTYQIMNATPLPANESWTMTELIGSKWEAGTKIYLSCLNGVGFSTFQITGTESV